MSERLKPRKYYWNKLNTWLANQVAEDCLTEEESERYLDHAQLTKDAEELVYFCNANDLECGQPNGCDSNYWSRELPSNMDTG